MPEEKEMEEQEETESKETDEFIADDESKADIEIKDEEETKAKKVKKEKKKKPRSRKKKGDEDIEIVEGAERAPRIKPSIDDETKELLALRKARKSKKPEFLRQEWYRYGRISMNWRRPRGIHSKMRRHFKRRINVVSIGYGSPSKVRSLHSSGFREKLVHNVGELDDIDPKTHAARIAHSVGTRKRLEIIRSADELGIRVLNRGVKREAKPKKEKKVKKEEEEEEIEIEETEGEIEEMEDEEEESTIEDYKDDETPEEDLGGEEEEHDTSDKERNKGGGAQGGEKPEHEEKGGSEQ